MSETIIWFILLNITIDNIDLFDISYDVFANQQKYDTHFNNYGQISICNAVYNRLVSLGYVN